MKKIFLIMTAVLCTLSLSAQPKLRADNIDEILKAMTLEEKAALLVGGGWGSMTAGSMTASSETLVSGAAGTTRPVERLGVPVTVLADGPRIDLEYRPGGRTDHRHGQRGKGIRC